MAAEDGAAAYESAPTDGVRSVSGHGATFAAATLSGAARRASAGVVRATVVCASASFGRRSLPVAAIVDDLIRRHVRAADEARSLRRANRRWRQ